MKRTKQSVGENIRYYRMKRLLEQKGLALLTELSGPTISNIELNKQMPSIRTVNKIAQVLRCRVSDLIQE